MGNINIENIRKKGFAEGTREEFVENYCRTFASKHTDGILELYKKLESSRNGKYINSDLMKMVFPFYASSPENRKMYNQSITNTAAVLTNEAYQRAILNPDVKRCIFVVGPYGAGKSFFVQSLFENDEEGLLEESIVYEGSITPPAFGEKIQYAMDNGVIPEIIAINPSLELSMRNIKERAKRIGRDVDKKEVVDKFSGMYENLGMIVNEFEGIVYRIYNKKSNAELDLTGGSTDLEDLNYGTKQEISEEYDTIKKMLEIESELEEAR
jgi:hypothetical protein